MKNKKIIMISIIVIVILATVFFLITGRARTDVYLKSFELSADEKTMILRVSSDGYVRTMKRTGGGINYNFTFYSTFGINSKLGAKDIFTIDIDNNVDEIYFYAGDKGYKKVLELNDDGKWITPEKKRYDEIRSDIDKEMERYIYVIAPKCYPNNGTPLITHQDLVYKAGMDKENFLDIDEKSYCKAFVDTKCVEIGKWEWKTMISCKDYEDKGYIDWDEGFEPKQ